MVGLAKGSWGPSDNAQCQHHVLQPTAPQPRGHRISVDSIHRFLFRESTHPRQEALSTQFLHCEMQSSAGAPTHGRPDTALDIS